MSQARNKERIDISGVEAIVVNLGKGAQEDTLGYNEVRLGYHSRCEMLLRGSMATIFATMILFLHDHDIRTGAWLACTGITLENIYGF